MKGKKIISLLLGALMLGALCGCQPSATPTPLPPSSDSNQSDGNGGNNQDNNNQDDQQQPPPPAQKGEPLTLSKASGAYQNAFDLVITPATEGNQIYYTLDGSAPTTASAVYGDKIHIGDPSASYNYVLTNGVLIKDPRTYGYYNYGTNNAANVLRLLEVDASGKEVARKSATYFIGKQFTLPVVSLSMPKEKALSFYNDIENESKERAELEYFDFASGEHFALNTQIKVGGNWTKGYPYRTMNLNFNKDENGKKNTPVTAKIFGDRKARDGGELTGFKRFRLHSGGNAQVLNWFADAFTQRVAAEVSTSDGQYLQVATAGYRPCEVYLNGEYWGLYAIREHYSDVYFEQNYGVDKDEVLLVDRSPYVVDTDPAYSDRTVYNTRYFFEMAEDNEQEDGSGMKVATDFFDYLMEGGFQDDTKYAELSSKVDLTGLADMILLHFYTGNWDFMNNNIKMWRTDKIDESNPYADGKWRFCLHDLDFSFEFQWADLLVGGANGYELGRNYLDWYMGIASRDGGWLSKEQHCLLSAPMQNEQFRTLLLERAQVIYEIYTNARANQILNAMKAEVDAPMQRHVVRWGRSGYNYNSWLYFIQRTREVLYDRNYLKIPPEHNWVVAPDGGEYFYPNGDYFLKQVESTIRRFEYTL